MAAEGWGLYAEELMAEPVQDRPYGFYSPGEYLYELQGQLLRAARVRIDVGLHTGRMTYDEAMNYFTEHVNFYPGACARAASDPAAKAVCDGATRAIYRYSKWPTQAITYRLGKQRILDLRARADQIAPGPQGRKRFHLLFMQQGTVPPGYFEDVLLAELKGDKGR